MNLEERVRLLLQSMEKSCIVLGGQILQTVPSICEQILIFESACNDNISMAISRGETSSFMSSRTIRGSWMGEKACFNLVGKNWTLYFNGSLFMLNAPHHPSLYNLIEI